jgi:hypothetical protein
MSRSVSLLCRRHAEDCLRMADQTDSAETRSILIMMAGAWHRLAQDLRLVEDVEATAHWGMADSPGLSRPSLPAGAANAGGRQTDRHGHAEARPKGSRSRRESAAG